MFGFVRTKKLKEEIEKLDAALITLKETFRNHKHDLETGVVYSLYV